MSTQSWSSGDVLEVVKVVAVRRGEDCGSAVITQLSAGQELNLVEVGSSGNSTRSRARVSSHGVEGWVTVVTSQGEQLVKKKQDHARCQAAPCSGGSDFQAPCAGELYAMLHAAALRADEPLHSEIVGEIRRGQVVRVLQVGCRSHRRARVVAEIAGPATALEGWVSLATSSGQVLAVATASTVSEQPSIVLLQDQDSEASTGSGGSASSPGRFSREALSPGVPGEQAGQPFKLGRAGDGAVAKSLLEDAGCEARRSPAAADASACTPLQHAATWPNPEHDSDDGAAEQERALQAEAEKRARLAAEEFAEASEELDDALAGLACSDCSDPCAVQDATERTRRAIYNARLSGVPEDLLGSAQSALEAAELRRDILRRLLWAQSVNDREALRSALEKARCSADAWANLDLKAMLAPFARSLARLEAKEAAVVMLSDAVETQSAAMLRKALEQAKQAGLGPEALAEAEKVLQLEGPRDEVRFHLFALTAATPEQELRALLARAAEVGLHPSEMEGVLELSRRAGLKKAAVQHLADLLAELPFGPRASASSSAAAAAPPRDLGVEALRRDKARLGEALRQARGVGVEEDALMEAEQRRRRLHNAVEDIKGAIRVFCRVRPLSAKEVEQGDTAVAAATDSMTLSVERGREQETFSFDSVFTPGSQDDVFEDCRDLVQSALDGYNVTLFAYGQTGAGKTFTMYGVPGQEGTAPKTIQELYRLIERDTDQYEHEVSASMMELYRNDLVDLLVESSGATSPKNAKGLNRSPTTMTSDSGAGKLNVRTDKNGAVQIDNLVEVRCESAAALQQTLERGNGQRTVAATAMNSESSRSHSLLIVRVARTNRQTEERTVGKILLCDLAGSERLKRSEVSGDMQKEAIEINKSLTALGDVIEGLTTKKSHVPYKNHKLTMVMQDALGGSSKTLMFVNCSPASSNLEETLNALKYATRAKKITNTPKVDSPTARSSRQGPERGR